MQSTSEKTFGAKLRNAQTLSLVASETPNYNPPNPDDKLTAFDALLQNIGQQNAAVAALLQSHESAVKTRQEQFEKGENSMAKLLSPIRSVVQSMFGGKSLEVAQVSRIIQQIRGGKPKRNSGSSPNSPDQTSYSQQSYGSQLQFFNDLIQTLQGINGYNPDRRDIQIPTLQALAQDLAQTSNRVLLATSALKNARNQRNGLYEELSKRAERIKAHIKGNNGLQSPQYKMIKKLVI